MSTRSLLCSFNPPFYTTFPALAPYFPALEHAEEAEEAKSSAMEPPYLVFIHRRETTVHTLQVGQSSRRLGVYIFYSRLRGEALIHRFGRSSCEETRKGKRKKKHASQKWKRATTSTAKVAADQREPRVALVAEAGGWLPARPGSIPGSAWVFHRGCISRLNFDASAVVYV